MVYWCCTNSNLYQELMFLAAIQLHRQSTQNPILTERERKNKTDKRDNKYEYPTKTNE